MQASLLYPYQVVIKGRAAITSCSRSSVRPKSLRAKTTIKVDTDGIVDGP